MLQQPTSRLVLLPIFFALQLAAWIQHNVLHLPLHVLDPGSQPRYSVIMTHLLPSAAWWWGRYFAILRAIYYDVLGHYPSFYKTHLGMLATTTEQTRRFNFEVSYLFLVPVDYANAILFCHLFVRRFQCSLFLLGAIPILFGYFCEVGCHRTEVAFF
uniref:Uncharacterized protein n=1 Tax=Anopheles christyi TaxID=43041 RepID=A0A182KI72_9DIPT